MLNNVEDSKKSLILGIKQYVQEAKADGVLIGLSGGMDSTVAGWFAVQALSPSNVYGLILPAGKESKTQINLAEKVSSWLQIDHNTSTVYLEKAMYSLLSGFRGPHLPDYHQTMTDLKSRLRMASLYYQTTMLKLTEKKKLLVMGSLNRSEHFTGYFTKYGDSGADFEPLGDLLKTEVFQLARSIPDFPEEILKQRSAARLYLDDHEYDMDYRELDKMIESYESEGEAESEDWLNTRRVHENTQHKREMPPAINVKAIKDRVKEKDLKIGYEELDQVIAVLVNGGFEEWKNLDKDTRLRILEMNEKARYKSTIPPIIEVTK